MSGSASSSGSTSPSKLQISVSTGSLPMPSSSPIPSPTSSVVSFTLPSPATSTTGSSTGTAPAVRMTRSQRLRDQAAAARSTATATPEPVVPTNNDPNMKKRMVAKTRTSATLGQEVLNKIKPANPMNPLPLNNLSGSSSSSSSSTPLATSIPSARIRNRRPILVVKGGNTRNIPSARGSTAQSTTGAPSSSRPSTATTTGKHPRLSLTDRAILQDICIIQDWLTTVKQNKNLTQFSHIVDKLKTAIFLPTQVKRQRVKQRGVPSDRPPRMLHRMSQATISRPSSAQPPLSSEGEDSGREYVVAGQGHEEEDTEDDFILNDDDELDAKMTQYINRTEQDDDNLLMRRTVKSPTGVVFENGRWVASSAATAGTPSIHRHVGAGNITSLTSLSSLLIKSTSGTSTPMNELNDDIISSLSSNADNDADGEGGSIDGTDEPLEQVPTYQEFPDNLDDIADFDDDPSSGNVSSSNNQPILSDAVLSPSSTSSAQSSPKSSLTRLSSTSSLLAPSSDTTATTSTSTSTSTSSTTSTSTSTLPAPNRLQHFREASADFDVGTEFQLSHEQRRKLAPIHVIAKPTSISSHIPMTDIGDDDMDVFDNIPDFDSSPSNKFDTSDSIAAMSTSNSASSSVISSPSSSQRAQGRDSIISNPSLSIHVSTISPQMLTITTMRTSNNNNNNNNNTSTGTGSGTNSSASSPSMKTSSIATKTPTHLSTFKPALSTVYSPPDIQSTTSTSTSTTTSTSLAAPTLDLDDMSDGDEISSRSRAASTHDASDDTRTDNEVDAELDEMGEAIAIKPDTNTSTPTHATTQPVTGNIATATHDDTSFPDDLDDLEGFPDDDVTTDDTSTSTSTKSRSAARRTSNTSTEDEMINIHATDMTGMSGPSSRILNEFTLSPELISNLQSCADSHNKKYSCVTPYLGKASSLTTKDPFQPQFVVGWMLELGKHFAKATELGNSS